jgi:hypothetical protein
MKASSCKAIDDGPQSSIDGNGSINKRIHKDMMIQEVSSNISGNQQQNPSTHFLQYFAVHISKHFNHYYRLISDPDISL